MLVKVPFGASDRGEHRRWPDLSDDRATCDAFDDGSAGMLQWNAAARRVFNRTVGTTNG